MYYFKSGSTMPLIVFVRQSSHRLMRILVPERERRAGAAVKEIDYEDGSDLRTGLLGAAARGAHDCEPDGGADRVRGETTIWRSRRSGSSKTKAIAVRRSSDRALSGSEILPPKVRSRRCWPTRPIG